MPTPAVRYPNHYCWLVLVGMLDVMLTSVVMTYLEGREANPLAQWFIDRLDLWGLILLKVITLVVFVGACEAVGARKPDTGRKLAEYAIVVCAFPVVFALLLLLLPGEGS